MFISLEDIGTNAPEQQRAIEAEEDCDRSDSVVEHWPLFYQVVERGYTWQDLRKKETVAYPHEEVGGRCNSKHSIENSNRRSAVSLSVIRPIERLQFDVFSEVIKHDLQNRLTHIKNSARDIPSQHGCVSG